MRGQSAAKAKINKIYNKIQILSIYGSIKGRRYFNVKCLNCSKLSIMRSDSFTGKNKLNTCKHCRQQNAIDKSKIRASSETVYNVLFSTYKTNAKNRNLDFNLSKNFFKHLISQPCYYCASNPIESITSKRHNKTKNVVKHNGLDRVDNTKGYTIDNIVPCCTICNNMKKVFINQCILISNVHRPEHSARTLQANGSGNGEHPTFIKEDEDMVKSA